MKKTSKSEVFFKKNKKIETLEAFIVDVNGILRGKVLPKEQFPKVFKSGLRMPRSAYALDIWGQDVLPAGLVAETGDNDGICKADEKTLKKIPWLSEPVAQVIMSMKESKGGAFFGDPRHVLQSVLDLYAKEGWTPVVAAELEFYFLDNMRDEFYCPQPPLNPRTGERSDSSQLYSMNEMEDFSGALDDIRKSCKALGIPADAAISENGPGQYEINLNHVPDALAAADYAVLMKRAVRGVAHKHFMDATFMAKPYADMSGSGMHVHFSVIDKKGKNIFAGVDEKGSPLLKFAIGGLLKTMRDSVAVFAPNANSYRRLRPGTHAPTKICWGYDNRSTSIRVPESDIAATRIEHRVAGADCNPYLVFAVMLAGAYHGMKNKISPPPAIKGNAYAAKVPVLPTSWEEALSVFEKSAFIDKYLGKKYKKLYLACKRQEKELLESQVPSVEHDAYLRDI